MLPSYNDILIHTSGAITHYDKEKRQWQIAHPRLSVRNFHRLSRPQKAAVTAAASSHDTNETADTSPLTRSPDQLDAHLASLETRHSQLGPLIESIARRVENLEKWRHSNG